MPVVVEGVRVLPPRSRDPIPGELNCTFLDGHVTLVVGTSGAGKSSLLRAAAGVWPLAKGRVRYDEAILWEGDGKRLNQTVQQRIGYVFQQPEDQLFARTVRDELVYSLRPYNLPSMEVERRIATAISDFHLDPAVLHESPLSLSAGQKRRVAMAATVATGADWLWFDEPTAGLDPMSVGSFVTLVKTLVSSRRDSGRGGIVIATHDLDWLLPIATDLVILECGSVCWSGPVTSALETPHPWQTAGVGLPDRIALAIALHEAGWTHVPTLADPDALADAIVAETPPLREEKTARPAIADLGMMRFDLHAPPLSSGADQTEPSPPTSAQPAQPHQPDQAPRPGLPGQVPWSTHSPVSPPAQTAAVWRRGWLDGFDPRAKWVFVVLASVAVLVQTTWLGIGLAALCTVVVAASAGLSLRQTVQALRPLLWVAAASGVVSGLRFGHTTAGLWHVGPVAYAFHSASLTLTQMAKVMVVVVLGSLLSTTTSTLAMKKGLERGLAPLAKIGLPVSAFALAAALMLRFIPLIFRETDRFALIARVRGKYPTRGNSLRLRDTPSLLVPLLLSVLRLGEDVALAIEARGYSRDRLWNRTFTVEREPLRRVEWGLMGIGLLWLVMFLVVSHALHR
ncbi:ATP-binding cassette domain-containing protein [Alicyclobacillus sp. ALC3]|uniref:ATP-binding cassette domain-containing protein n=1 Tax=Alicyclobacillus sp. ALC3 TaxID=2796143 RepID=UPI0023786C37|nr:ATP-binding cassette domain-containing protein [Alicyclobacillus sp. ALC3]WDL98734.1 ATP-binding cassette domain-containing protein [Alicyclobacillus sp. ALC3]